MISIRFFIPGFHCQMKKQKKTMRRLRAPPLWVFVVFHLAVETQNKKRMEIVFFIKGRPNFWPRIENRLWVVLALNQKPRGALIKNSVF